MVKLLISHPPYWIIAVLVAVLVSYSLGHILRVVRGPRPNDPLLMLELLVTFGLLFLCVQRSIDQSVTDRPIASWLEGPLPLACLLVYFTPVSMAVYTVFSVLHRRRVRRKSEPTRRTDKT